MALIACLIVYAVGGFLPEMTALTVTSVLSNPSMYLNMPPYRSYISDFPRPSYIDDVTDQQLREIAAEYGMDVQDLYQQYALINADEHWSPSTDVEVIKKIAKAFDRERIRQGLLYRTPLSYESPLVYTQSILQRREPEGVLRGLYDDITGNLGAAYNGLKGAVGRVMPETTNALSKDINDALHTSPANVVDDAKGLTKKLDSNIRGALDKLV